MNFETFLVEREALIRLGTFVTALLLIAAWELRAPLRASAPGRTVRWANNLALAILNMALLRLAFPLAAVYLAILASERGLGLFHLLPAPYLAAVGVSLLAFDLSVYLVHLAFHHVPLLWRMHRVHHADLDVDVVTALRFHPIQMLLSVVLKFSVILALGVPVLAVVIFETAFHVVLLFSHANVRIPRAVDRLLRWFIVTPDMHRVHHSIRSAETNSNFGFGLPWWDRLFGTYRAEPALGHERMTLGIERFRRQRDLWLDQMLINPFLSDKKAAGRLLTDRPTG
jgi:sterol desaturase/sphingolipid hydroxylase (fatty acid hydroxylase superfamily)